jgi:hypothetical protein
MTEINQQPMSESLEEQKKKRPICEICKEDRSYQNFGDAIISFVQPMEHYHLDCLQIGFRQLRKRYAELNSRKLTHEAVQRALDKAIRNVIIPVPMDDIIGGKIVHDIQISVLVDELNAELKVGQ